MKKKMEKTKRRKPKIVRLSLEDQRRIAEESKVGVAAAAAAAPPHPTTTATEKEIEKISEGVSKLKIDAESRRSSLPDCRRQCPAVEVTMVNGSTQEDATRSLEAAMSPYRNHGFRIEWVSGTVAVVFLRSHLYAADAVGRLSSPAMRVIIASDSTSGETLDCLERSREDDSLFASDRRPFQTTTSVARRLIGAHLGLRKQFATKEGSVADAIDGKRP